MAGFLYFLPAIKAAVVIDGRLSPSLLDRYRLTNVLRDVGKVPNECIIAEVPTGPDDRRGVLLYPVPVHGDLPHPIAYAPNKQHWTAIGDGAHIGYYSDAPPRPIDIERRRQIPGWEIRDAYGDGWSIPCARSARNARGNLPFVVRWDDNAAPYCGVAAEHAELWDDSARLWDMVLAGARDEHSGLAMIGDGFDDAEDAFLLDMAHRALAINYRVSPRELRLYDQARPDWMTQVTASLIANAVVDMQGRRQWEDAQKKTVTLSPPAGVSSTPGATAATPNTNPPAQN